MSEFRTKEDDLVEKLVKERQERLLQAKDILDREKATPEERAKICFPAIRLETNPMTLHQFARTVGELRYAGYADSTVFGIVAIKGPKGTWGYAHKSENITPSVVVENTEFVSVEKTD